MKACVVLGFRDPGKDKNEVKFKIPVMLKTTASSCIKFNNIFQSFSNLT